MDNDPNSLMRQWRHDDEEVAYPTFELDRERTTRKLKSKKPGFNNICVHKGLRRPPDPLRGHPGDLPKAAKDWPKLNFITYHACIQPAMFLLRHAGGGALREDCAKEYRHQLDHENTPCSLREFEHPTPRSERRGLRRW